jgi:NADPH-dependent curcumin reductase CurA
MDANNRQVIFESRPSGWVAQENFGLRNGAVPVPGPGQMLIRNIYMSVDPYMRGRMVDKESYDAPLLPGDVLACRVVGQIVTSNHPDYEAGEFVFAMLRWERYSLADGSEDMRKLDPDLAPLSWHLGVLGAPGLTAYVGMIHFGQPKDGEQVYVSAASGAVGQIACQLAKMQGCRVIGSAGSDAKVAFLSDELGLDAAFNYHSYESYGDALDTFCPDLIDIYFDNVGGTALDAVLNRCNPFARCVECGMISQYNLEETDPIHNLVVMARYRITLRGFIVRDHFDLLPGYLADMAQWLKDGKVRYIEDITEGLDNAPAAFIGMLKGENFGKQVVQIGEDSTRG